MNKKIMQLMASAAIITSLFAACSEGDEMIENNQNVMDFSVFANKTTRAPETNTSLNSDGKSFGVWGYSTYDGTVTTVFNNQAVTYSGTSSAWTYTPPKYWDKESSYKFYAYYPYMGNGAGIADGKIKVTDFSVNSVVADQVDLMLAGKVERAVSSTNTIQFTFNHLLSNINLTFKKGTGITTPLTLNSVRLYGMVNKGTFTQNAETAVQGTWTTSGDAIILDNATELASGNTVANPVTFGDMLLIPQGTADLKLDIRYTLGDGANAQPFHRTLELKTDPATTWGQNQKITYNFTINADVIEFGNPTISDWSTNSDINVPEIN